MWLNCSCHKIKIPKGHKGRPPLIEMVGRYLTIPLIEVKGNDDDD